MIHSGEPMRVITGGVPHVPGDTVYEQMAWLKRQMDCDGQDRPATIAP
ncbi:proline racemase family protein [Saccharopolyspora erythraea]